jgi:zinc D-Ala-D-Ala carboxypeptidase
MEQRDQLPEPAADDIGRAAAEASVRAEEYDVPADDYRGPAGSRPRRWLVVGGVAVAALAVAGTAAGIAGHSHSPRSDTALNAAVSSDPESSTPGTPSQDTPTTDGTTPSGTTAPTTPPTTPSTSPKKAPTTAPKTSTSPSTTSTTAPAGEGGDCETTTHDTAADEAKKFSGMTHGTQDAFLSAQKAAQAKGLTFLLNSGYRSAAYQQRIFDCWVKQLGSAQAARQYALPPDESAHVQGYAMDIAPPSAAAWLESTKGQYGLCRRYADETWHFEYQARYKTGGCPALVPHP